MAEAVSGNLPPGWHQPMPQPGRGHSSPLTNSLHLSSCCSHLFTRLATGTAARWVLPGYLPDSGPGPKLCSRAVCSSRGHQQQVDERGEQLDLGEIQPQNDLLAAPILCLLQGPSLPCSHLSSAFLPPQHRRTSETSISPPGSSIGSPNRVICVSRALSLVCMGQDG